MSNPKCKNSQKTVKKMLTCVCCKTKTSPISPYPLASSNTSPDHFETTQPPPYMPKGISASMKKILKGAKLKPSSYESIHKILLDREQERENNEKGKRNCSSPERRMTEMKRFDGEDLGSAEL